MPCCIHVVGSLVIDRVIRVPALPRPGETVLARSEVIAPGGKGANQAVAAARCGARVRMFGRTGGEGRLVAEALADAGVDTSDVVTADPTPGAATVLVADSGENAIAVLPAANHLVRTADVARFLGAARAGELALFQNECSDLPGSLEAAFARGLRTWLNAAPADAALAALPLDRLDGIIVNETEAEALSGQADPRLALTALAERMRGRTVVITLGAAGVIAHRRGAFLSHRGFRVRAVDTVGCGDAFVGSFLAALAEGVEVAPALARGNAAGALAAMRSGAIPSLPDRESVLALAGREEDSPALDSRA